MCSGRLPAIAPAPKSSTCPRSESALRLCERFSRKGAKARLLLFFRKDKLEGFAHRLNASYFMPHSRFLNQRCVEAVAAQGTVDAPRIVEIEILRTCDQSEPRILPREFHILFRYAVFDVIV